MTVLQIALLFFMAVLLGLTALYMWYAAVKASPRYELKKRLRYMAMAEERRVPEDLKVEILHEMSPLDKFLYRFGFVRRLDRWLDQAGLKIDVKVFMLVIPVSVLAGFMVGIVLSKGNLVLPFIFAVLAGSVPFFFLKFRKDKRMTQFMDQFPNALDMVSRSLKAGHSFTAAVQMVGSEMAEPTAGLFRTVYDEQAFGLSMPEALDHMTRRMDSTDLRFFVAAVNVHRDVGGNLSEILERLAQTIRERIKIRRQVRVYTAQARLSGYILAALPIAMALFFYTVSPDYIEELIKIKTGWYVVGAAIAAQIIGFLVIRKIINIRI
jgi:tight adherence protein B